MFLDFKEESNLSFVIHMATSKKVYGSPRNLKALPPSVRRKFRTRPDWECYEIHSEDDSSKVAGYFFTAPVVTPMLMQDCVSPVYIESTKWHEEPIATFLGLFAACVLFTNVVEFYRLANN